MLWGENVMETGWLETFIFLLLASVKFAVAVPFFIIENKLTFLQGFLFGVSSGLLGVLTFMFLSTIILRFWHWLKEQIGIKPAHPKKLFSKRSRMLVRIKSKYGLAGIALLSPIIISIPVGAFIAMRYFKNKKKVFLYMFAGVVLWSLIFASSASLVIKIFKTIELALVTGN
ncbi:MAG: hypothetical protein N2167_07220 [Flavobacteriales bacterium]|nr:hypothetical protein [Flavobacteriales bacterium]